jgi:phosphoribosylglycinamide formyltransferase 1
MEQLAILLSGGGSTAEAVIKACKPDGKLYGHVNPVLVVSSRADAKGLKRAVDTGLIRTEDAILVSPRNYESPFDFGVALIRECTKRKVTLFAQLGWMVKTPKNFIKVFPRGINQHPAPLCPGKPDFGGEGMYGRRCHFARLMFVRMTGRTGAEAFTMATSQRVHPEYDRGEVVNQHPVLINPDDTVESLQERVLPFEHKVQIETLLDFAQAKVKTIKPDELMKRHEMAAWALCREMAKLAYPKG